MNKATKRKKIDSKMAKRKTNKKESKNIRFAKRANKTINNVFNYQFTIIIMFGALALLASLFLWSGPVICANCRIIPDPNIQSASSIRLIRTFLIAGIAFLIFYTIMYFQNYKQEKH